MVNQYNTLCMDKQQHNNFPLCLWWLSMSCLSFFISTRIWKKSSFTMREGHSQSKVHTSDIVRQSTTLGEIRSVISMRDSWCLQCSFNELPKVTTTDSSRLHSSCCCGPVDAGHNSLTARLTKRWHFQRRRWRLAGRLSINQTVNHTSIGNNHRGNEQT